MAVEIYPVVHINEPSQALDQLALSFELGADGVFLIDHNSIGSAELLLETYNLAADMYPENFLGLNFLQHESAARSLSFLLDCKNSGTISRFPDGLWADNADTGKVAALELRASHPELNAIQYLGGVAFKYTEYYTDSANGAAFETTRLAPYVDVITTSGRGTGHAPTPDKIRAMKLVADEKKLAVASGISIDNINQYNGTFDKLLVSSSVEQEPYSGVFIPTRLDELIQAAHSL